MKKPFYLLVLCAILFSSNSCKKDSTNKTDSDVAPFMMFKVDGVQHNMTTITAVQSNPNSGIATMTIVGGFQNEYLNIVIKKISGSISAGVVSTDPQQLSLYYSTGPTGAESYLGGNVGFYNSSITPTEAVTITTLTNDFIEGTFAFNAGNYSLVTNPGTKNITEGSFKAAIVHQ